MSATGAFLAALLLCCVVLGMAQAAELRRLPLALLAAGLAMMLVLTGELASRTSLAQVAAWASDSQRRLDLSALLLAEALFYMTQALLMAQGDASVRWRWLNCLPAPSLLLSAFLAQVLWMLSIDGVSYSVLSWICALLVALFFMGGALLLRWALPQRLMRTGLRLWLHTAQVAAALWLARPLVLGTADPLPAAGHSLLILAAFVAGLAAVGWALQRLSILE